MIIEPSDHDDSGLDSWRKLPIFNQVEVILHLVEYNVEGLQLTDICDLSEYKKGIYTVHSYKMMENALLISQKIAEAHQADVYDIKMENATLIRKAAREIIHNTRNLQRIGYKDHAYLELLIEALEVFRHLFAQWIQTFDCTQYVVDPWGLFNPQGISYKMKNIVRLDPNDFYE